MDTGRQRICALGLGKFHKESNAFHCFCREQDVEARVKAGVANGFELQREMEQAFAAHKGADTPPTPKREESRKRGKRKAAGEAAGERAQPLNIKKAATACTVQSVDSHPSRLSNLVKNGCPICRCCPYWDETLRAYVVYSDMAPDGMTWDQTSKRYVIV